MAETQPDETGFVRNPLAQWKNDDLLLDEETRNQVRKDRPRAFPIVDWPEMRTLFKEIDQDAIAAKRKVRSQGVLAVWIATSGLVLAAFATWLAAPGSAAAVLFGIVSTLLLVGGVCLGLLPLLFGRDRSDWLVTRLKAERLRQLHFQFILGNLELAVRAMTDPAALEELHAKRAEALKSFADRLNPKSPAALFDVLRDSTAQHVWQDARWSAAPPSGKALPASEIGELLDALRRLRFGVQRHYAIIAVQEHFNAPGVRSTWLHRGADALTVAMLIASLLLALSLLFGLEGWDRALIALAASCAAGVAAFRTLEEGLRYGDDALRMAWYLAAIDALEADYDRLQASGRIRLHQELEALAYREMREFLTSHHRARFVLQ